MKAAHTFSDPWNHRARGSTLLPLTCLKLPTLSRLHAPTHLTASPPLPDRMVCSEVAFVVQHTRRAPSMSYDIHKLHALAKKKRLSSALQQTLSADSALSVS